MGRREAGKETSTEKVQGKRGWELNNKAGKKIATVTVCYLAKKTGTVEILMGFLNLRVTNSLTDRDRPTYTDSHNTHTHLHMLYMQYMELTVGGTII